MKNLLITTTLALTLLATTAHAKAQQKRHIDYVNTYVGTSAGGHTYPGVSQPYAMIQPGPDTGSREWQYCGGYLYEDKSIIGFTQTHLNGVGCMSCGDLLIQPFCGQPRQNLTSAFDRATETARPGYYGVTLSQNNVRVGITASPKVAFYRFTYDKPGASLLIDTQHGIIRDAGAPTRIMDGEFNFEDSQTITGYIHAKEWAKKKIFFVMKFDTPYASKKILPKKDKREKGTRAIITFAPAPAGGTTSVSSAAPSTVQVKIAISSVSIDGAKGNLAADRNDWDFPKARAAAENEWEKQLSVFDIQGTDEQKAVFYTAAYRLFLQPCAMNDADGRYRGPDDKIATLSAGHAYYSNLSIWDIFRAASPLYTITAPGIVDDLVTSMVDHGLKQGYLPMWPLWSQETHCMIANHSIAIITEAYNKGFRGFDVDKAYQAIRQTSFNDHRKSPWSIYEKYGYYPYDLVKVESVSSTLESAYDDWCAAQMAKSLGHTEDYERFMKRTKYIHNLWDSSTGFFRGKDSKGNWETPFDPLNQCHANNGKGSYTEANAWQYLWHVLPDTPAFIELMGGQDKFMAKLDKLFTQPPVVYGDGRVEEITGMVGQYVQGNEPSHHAIYFWSYTPRPWRAAELIREVIARYYQNKPDGLCGNEDMGQMSAWLIFSSMGFYPVDPASGKYIFGAPQLPQVTINMPGGKKFTIRAEGLSDKNIYIASIKLNGKPYAKNYISHEDIVAGGELVFTMTGERVNYIK